MVKLHDDKTDPLDLLLTPLAVAERIAVCAVLIPMFILTFILTFEYFLANFERPVADFCKLTVDSSGV